MARNRLQTLIRVAAGGELRLESDAGLVNRFVETAEHEAFAELVRRYARLVMGQCRQMLMNEADAEDAFQATFLALAKSARSIRTGERLGSWLHAVAHRICLNARRSGARRKTRERGAARAEGCSPIPDSAWDRAAAALHEEVHRLPDTLRVPFVLCCLEGIAPTVAAEQVGLKWGTFSARLSRAKRKLLDRLAQRGFGAAAVVGILGGEAAVSAGLSERAVQNVFPGAAVPASILSLTSGVSGMGQLKTNLSIALAVIVCGLSGATFLVPGQRAGSLPVANAAPVPEGRTEVKAKKLEELWTMLLSRDEGSASRAILEFASRPKNEVIGFFEKKLLPLKLDKERAEKLIAELGDEKKEVAQKAFDTLREFDPRIILTVEEMLKCIPEGRPQLRLMSLLIGASLDEYDNCRLTYTTAQVESAKAGRETCGVVFFEYLEGHPNHVPGKKTTIGTCVSETVKEVADSKMNRSWIRATRAITILEHLGTPDAVKVLEAMATGHADASPTKAARESLERLKQK